MSSILKLLTIVMASTSTLTKAEAADASIPFDVNVKHEQAAYFFKCGTGAYSALENITDNQRAVCPPEYTGCNPVMFKEYMLGRVRVSPSICLGEDGRTHCSIGNRHGDQGAELEVRCGPGS